MVNKKGVKKMSNGMMKFMKGMGWGLAVGCVAGAVGECYMRRSRRGFKKNMGKALKNVSELVEEVSSMF